MANNHYFYSRLSPKDMDVLVKLHQKEFDILLEDSFSDEELDKFEKMIDSIGAVYAQPILSELTFEDFYADPSEEEQQRKFFNQCRSSIAIENLPYLENNPIQVTYLLDLLNRFDELLIDQGGVSELTFKDKYVLNLKKYKTIDTLTGHSSPKPLEIKTSRPVDPIDFLIQDVYKELRRLTGQSLVVDELPPKIQKIFYVMKDETLDSTQLLRKVGLNAKEFDDGLERLKFWLRKL